MGNRGKALANDSIAGAASALVDASNDCKEETVSALINVSLHNDGFWSPCSKQAPDAGIPGIRSPVIRDTEVRRLQKALREIAQLELQLEVLAEAGGHLRRNQMQKIAKKQEHLDKLQ